MRLAQTVGRAGRRLGLLGLLGLAGWGVASPCAGLGRSLAVAGFGLAYFGEARLQDGVAELYGGVCLESEARGPGHEPLWTLRAQRMQVDTRLSPAAFSLAGAALATSGWLLEAGELEASAEGLALREVRFSGAGAEGRADEARFDVARGELLLSEVALAAPGYRLVSARARLGPTGGPGGGAGRGALALEEAVFTSCRGDEPFIRLAAPLAAYDPEAARARLMGAVLEVGLLALPLEPELELSAASLADLGLPVSVGVLERVGLSALLGLPLAEGLGLEAGVVGLDGPAPAGVFLLSLARPGLQAAIGRSRFGPQADVQVATDLAPWLRAVFAVHNRDWADADFLHEGLLRLEAASPPLSLLEHDRLQLSASALLAATRQTLGGRPVASARTTLAFSVLYRAPPSPLGQFSLVQDASYSLYPQVDASQVGLRLRPAWSGRFGPIGLGLDYDLQLTDAGSPFPRLDRLQPIHLLNFSAHAEAEGMTFALHGRYNFLAATNPWRRLELVTAAGADGEGWSTRVRLAFEAAGLLSPVFDPEVEAYVSATLGLTQGLREGELSLGFDGRYAFVSRGPGGLERLELSLSLPLQTSQVRLQPFLALDAADLVTGRGGLGLSGHGAELEWETCCGRLTLGYRLHRGRFTTNVGLRVDDGP